METQSPKTSRLPDTVELTRDGGNYYRALTWRWVTNIVAFPFVLALCIVAVLNPLWFRDRFFRWCENSVNRFVKWRNYRQYALYLGCDPEYWHTLKG